MSLELTGKQLQGLQRALMRAFPTRANLQQMVLFELDLPLNQVAGPGPLTDVVFQLIEWAKAHGKLEELIVGARSTNSGNPDLKAFVVEVSLCAEQPQDDGAIESQLQALVVEGPGRAGISVTDWRKKSEAAERTICRLEAGNGNFVGTGFLVAADVVMTNGHVADRLALEGGTPRARFDYRKEAAVPGGIEVSLAGQGWVLDKSPPAKLDYALLRLATPAGDAALAGVPRGWLTPTADYAFVKDEPLLILQHPAGRPLQISVGYLRDLNQQIQRIAYTVNTEGGSSGSPCFSMGWHLIALHHHGDRFTNHGVPMKAILKQMQQNGTAGILG